MTDTQHMGAVQLLPYLVVSEAELSSAAAAMALSPKVMGWDETTWLIDLRPTTYYWTKQAQLRGVKAANLLQATLSAALVRSDTDQPAWSLVFAPDPWQGLLLASHLKERGLGGLLELREPFSQAMLRQVSWVVWLETARAYGRVSALARTPRFSEDIFRRQLTHLEKTAGRLGQQRPAQMVDASQEAFRRRYGDHVARLWAWTFHGIPREVKPAQRSFSFVEEPVFASAFPWIGLVLSEKPRVNRHLEHPVWLWDQLAADLTADLDRLAHLLADEPASGVTALIWTLSLDDLTTCEVRVGFRHPHCLMSERGEQKTALSQAALSFDQVYARRCQDATDIPPAPLISWTLVAEECLAHTPLAADLFGNFSPSLASQIAQQRIDNQLPIALERYQVTLDWVPEGAFTPALGQDLPDAATAAVKPWAALAARRPLYLYSEPRALQGAGEGGKSHFIECTGEVWWQKPEGTLLERHYFLLQDRLGQRTWASKSDSGEWLVHGLFA